MTVYVLLRLGRDAKALAVYLTQERADEALSNFSRYNLGRSYKVQAIEVTE